MSGVGAIYEARVACQRVIDGVPLAQMEAARTRIRTALSTITAVGPSRHPAYRAALDRLVALQATLDRAQGHTKAAQEHARQFQGRL